MKQKFIALLCLSIFSSCAWFTSKPEPEKKPSEPKPESEMKLNAELEAENYISNGLTYHQDGKDSLAVLAWKKALELLPGDAEIHNFLGNSYFRLKELDEASAQFRIATELDPNYYQAFNNLGYVLFLQEKYSKAKTAFNKSLEKNPEYQPAILNLKTLSRMESGELSKDVFELSQKVENIEDLDKKINTYNEILAMDSTFAQGHNNIGVAYYYKFVEGDGDENDSSYYAYLDSAYYHLNKSIELNKNNPEAINNLGYIYKVAGRYEDAIKLFLRAIALKTEYILALNNLGETYELNSEYENAKRVFKTVLDLEPTNEFARDSFELLIEKEQK